MKTKNILKFTGLIIFLGVAYYATNHGPLAGELSRSSLRSFVESLGLAAPLIYILLYAVAICFFVPGTLMTAVGGVTFGTLWGFILTLIGATIGASVAFLLARFLGKDFVDSLLDEKLEKLKKYDDMLKEHGFATIFYLRLVYFPFTALNFGAGLTKVDFKEYFWGTLLGIIPGTFIFVFFFDSISAITSFSDLLTWKVGLAVLLFAVSFTIPYFVKKYGKGLFKVKHNN